MKFFACSDWDLKFPLWRNIKKSEQQKEQSQYKRSLRFMLLFSPADGFHNTIINHNKGFICGHQKDLGSRDILELLLTSAPSLSKRRTCSAELGGRAALGWLWWSGQHRFIGKFMDERLGIAAEGAAKEWEFLSRPWAPCCLLHLENDSSFCLGPALLKLHLIPFLSPMEHQNLNFSTQWQHKGLPGPGLVHVIQELKPVLCMSAAGS